MVVRNSQPITKAAAPRLPPLPKLRVRRPNAQAQQGPCVGVMTTVLACWASSGHAAQACALLEQQLRACMDAPRPNAQRKSSINYHLGRFYPQIVGPTKKK
ncbi:mitochondrial ribosomal protein 10 [Myriangium duriaei CBS 260.36]|uniref:Small ribosomal subunit protein mS37 n=1 Tax=Myriangium duriaei CBS 260.36 TaxID=1168546 RepID=A0A9P4J4P8_9PEZI|nr:mitochondrial ribosomal protein 10 [Myriangium duriaei CBS 260.36]